VRDKNFYQSYLRRAILKGYIGRSCFSSSKTWKYYREACCIAAHLSHVRGRI